MTEAKLLMRKTLYSEAGGFVLLDVEGIMKVWTTPETVFPCDFLAKLADEEEVAKAMEAGALLPIVVDESDEYEIAVYEGAPGAKGPGSVLGVESGWFFHAGSQHVHFLGIGHLKAWAFDRSDGAPISPTMGDSCAHCRWGDNAGFRYIELFLEPKSPSSFRRDPPVEIQFLSGSAH